MGKLLESSDIGYHQLTRLMLSHLQIQGTRMGRKTTVSIPDI
jgi:hypothetical protein